MTHMNFIKRTLHDVLIIELNECVRTYKAYNYYCDIVYPSELLMIIV